MRFGRAAQNLADTVTGLDPEVRETLKAVRTAADTLTVVLTTVLVLVAIGMILDGPR